MIKNKIFFILNLNLFSQIIYSEILIITTAYNRPEFIELQHKTFKRFLLDEYKFVVFNDAQDDLNQIAIRNECNKFNIQCFDMPQNLHNCDITAESFLKVKQFPAFRHGEVVRYAFETLGFKHKDIVVLIDSDCFLVTNFSIRNYLLNYQISGRKIHCGKLACTPGADLVFFDMKNLPKPESMIFESCFLGHTFKDPLFMLEFYLYGHPEVKIKFMEFLKITDLVTKNKTDLINMGFNKHQIQFIRRYKKIFENNKSEDIGYYSYCGFFEKSFLNFHAGLDKSKINQLRSNLFRKYILSII